MFLAPGGGPKSTAWGGCEGKGQKKICHLRLGGGGVWTNKNPLGGDCSEGGAVDKYALNRVVWFF